MTNTSDPATATAVAVATAFPGLRQVHPHVIGAALADVCLDPRETARFAWCGYEVHVTVGPERHLNTDDVEDTSLQREVRAYATLLVAGVVDAPTRGHVEWEMTSTRPELLFPAAVSAAAADLDDSRFRSAVLATVAKALDYARIATGHAGVRAEEAAEEQRWERERPQGVARGPWMRSKREERAARARAVRPPLQP